MAAVPVIVFCVILSWNCPAASGSRTENVSSFLTLPSFAAENTSIQHEHVYFTSTELAPTARSPHASTAQQKAAKKQTARKITGETSSPASLALITAMLSANYELTSKRQTEGKVETSSENVTRHQSGSDIDESEMSAGSFDGESQRSGKLEPSLSGQSNTSLPGLSNKTSEDDYSDSIHDSLIDWLETLYPTDGNNQADDSCPTKTVTIANATTSNVTWSYNNTSCEQEYEWIITPPQGYFYVIEFHEIDLHPTFNLLILALTQPSEKILRNFTTSKEESLTPALTPAEAIKIRLFTQSRTQGLSLPSHFYISFTAELMESMPGMMVKDAMKYRESLLIYLCTGIAVLPTAITCDGIRHCEHGEDEAGCAYTQDQCGDWFPYGDHCLKAMFKNSFSNEFGQFRGAAPLDADERCQSEYNATLAYLPDEIGIQTAANLIHKSGFLNAAVGIRKFRPVSRKMKHLYRFVWQWGKPGSNIAYEQQNLQRGGTMNDCGILHIFPKPRIKSVACLRPKFKIHGFICMRPKSKHFVPSKKVHSMRLPRASQLPDQFPVKQCPDGSVVQTFHPCQWGQQDSDNSVEWSQGNLPLFQCRFGPAIHYSLLCDGNDDCPDRSDERVCQNPQFHPLISSSFVCRNSQMVAAEKRCDGVADCRDDSDEEYCISCHELLMCLGIGCIPGSYSSLFTSCPTTSPRPIRNRNRISIGAVHFDGYGMSQLNPVVSEGCPEGFYACSNGLCIPAFLINNGEKDCIQGEDENIPVRNITCPRYYRCKGTGSCVHKNYLCDGIYHCPDKDDEMFCHMTCPTDQSCVCEGHAFTCSKMVNPFQHLQLRYLDVSRSSNVSLENIHVMEYLFFLNLSFCHLRNVTLRNMPQVQILDLSFNLLTKLADVSLHKLSGLLHLNLSSNPLGRTLSSSFDPFIQPGEFFYLETLILSNTSLEKIPNRMFSSLTKIRYLDFQNNDLQRYYKESLWGLDVLEFLFTDQSNLCCPYFHFSNVRCHAPVDELSSCDDLLRENFFRLFLWTISVLAILGNAGVLVYRFVTDAHMSVPASKILLKNLCVSDFLMGIYLMVIGVADTKFQGNYVAKKSEWTSSMACTIAGCLSFVSSEVSAFLLCVITLDRVLAICFPLNQNIHLGSRITIFACCFIWIIGIAMAAAPLIFGIEFYGLNGVCLPLPITQKSYSGQSYAFSIFIVLNFGIVIFISAGQLLIYRAIRNSRKAAGNQQRHKDMTIAHRLFAIIFTDFCCWFPVGLMGILASYGVPIPGQLNVWTVIFVLPVNSALNPFLYTLNSLMEEWKKRKIQEREQRMLGRLQTEIPKWQPSAVEKLAKICIMSKKVQKDKLITYITSTNISSPDRQLSLVTD